MQLNGIIVKYSTDMLINSEGLVNLDLSLLNIETGRQIVTKIVKVRWGEY